MEERHSHWMCCGGAYLRADEFCPKCRTAGPESALNLKKIPMKPQGPARRTVRSSGTSVHRWMCHGLWLEINHDCPRCYMTGPSASRRFRPHGCDTAQRLRKFSDQTEDTIAQRLRSGESKEDLASEYGCAPNTILSARSRALSRERSMDEAITRIG